MPLAIDPKAMKRREQEYRKGLADPALSAAAKNALRRALNKNLAQQRLIVRYPELAPKPTKPTSKSPSA